MNHGFSNGDLVLYSVDSGAVIGGLTDGVTYKAADVGGVNTSTLKLHAFADTISVTFVNNGAAAPNDKITRAGGSWVDALPAADAPGDMLGDLLGENSGAVNAATGASLTPVLTNGGASVCGSAGFSFRVSVT